MPNYIDLFDAGRRIGTFDLPPTVQGTCGEEVRLIRVIRGGGNGIVFLAVPRGPLANELDECAVKLLRQQDSVRLDRFANEARIMQQLQHPRIAQLFAEGTLSIADGVTVPWMAMELGEDNLRHHVQAHGPLNCDALVRVGVQIADALQHLHSKQIIHRDVKPDNFVWDGEDEGDIKMIDFGIAKFIGEDVSGRPLDQFTQQMEFVGPVFFSSPELIAYASDKRHTVDARSDLFQLGKVLWFLATGRVSAGIPTRRDCPFAGGLHEIVLALLHDDPGDRPQSAEEAASALRSLAA
jgi:eukaryotic-like serine/threonine-protein kinase